MYIKRLVRSHCDIRPGVWNANEDVCGTLRPPFCSVWIGKSRLVPLDLPIQREQILGKLFRHIVLIDCEKGIRQVNFERILPLDLLFMIVDR